MAQWFDKNKKAVYIGGGGIVGLLLIVLAIKFVFSIDFSKKQTRDREVSQQLNTPISNSQDNSSNQSTNTTFEREIPKPLVPIVGASNVLPAWTQREDIEGNYPLLTGLYVGAIGKKPFKLVISNVDTINKTLSNCKKIKVTNLA